MAAEGGYRLRCGPGMIRNGRARIQATPHVVDLLDPSKGTEVAQMMTTTFLSTSNEQVCHIAAVHPKEAAGRGDAFESEVRRYFAICNESVIRSGGDCMEFRGEQGDLLGVCIHSPPVVPPDWIELQEGEEYLDDYDGEVEANISLGELFHLWGVDSTQRLREMNESVAPLLREAFEDNKTLCIDTLCASREQVGSGIGREMLRQLLANPVAVQGAEYVMAMTFTRPEFWTRIGLARHGDPVTVPDYVRDDGTRIAGFDITVHKGRIADVLARLNS